MTAAQAKDLALTFIRNYAIGIASELQKPEYDELNSFLKTKLAENKLYIPYLFNNNKISQKTKDILDTALGNTIDQYAINHPRDFVGGFIDYILTEISKLPNDDIKYRAQSILQNQPGTNMVSSTYYLPASFDDVFYKPLTATGKTNRDEQIAELCINRFANPTVISRSSAATQAPLGLGQIGATGASTSSVKQKCPASLDYQINKAKIRITQAMGHINNIENTCKSQSGGYRRKSRKSKPRKSNRTYRR